MAATLSESSSASVWRAGRRCLIELAVSPLRAPRRHPYASAESSIGPYHSAAAIDTYICAPASSGRRLARPDPARPDGSEDRRAAPQPLGNATARRDEGSRTQPRVWVSGRAARHPGAEAREVSAPGPRDASVSGRRRGLTSDLSATQMAPSSTR